MIRVRGIKLEEVLILRRMTKDPVRGDRARVIFLSNRGDSATQIAEKLGLNPKTVRKWIRLFNAHGVEGLRTVIRRGEGVGEKCQTANTKLN